MAWKVSHRHLHRRVGAFFCRLTVGCCIMTPTAVSADADPNIFHHDETYRGEITSIPPPPPSYVATSQSLQIPRAPSSQPLPPAATTTAAATTEPQKISLYVPCPQNNCDQPGCEGCIGCDKLFTCTREECEVPLPHELEQGICDVANKYADNWDEFGREMNEELCCLNENDRSGKCYTVTKCSKCDTEGPEFGKSLLQWLHIPYLPLFHRPGWLMRYMVGPHDQELMNMLFADFVAGLTIALTYVPQALSYAKLANLPAINGLYACILPAAVYCFYGTSMQLAVGPVAIVSLLTGGLVSQYQPDFATNTVGAVDTAAQACLSVGIIMCCMSLLNLGSFIQFIAHPVMSGFTTGAAMSIGLSQVKSAFGFATLPSNCVGYTEGNSPAQQGQKAYPYNSDVMAWYTQNWYTQFKVSPTANAKQTATANAILQGTPSAINPLAVKICFAIFVPITIMNYFKSNVFKATSERKKRWSYWIFNIVTSLLPFFCLIIATNQTLSIKKNTDFYSNSLSIVGVVAPGLNILRSPTMQHPFGPFFVDCIPIALIAFMESYAVARRIASTNHQLYLINASQELWANGVANMLNSISSGYPVSGSFSRSSLNQNCGAKTPFSQVVTLCIILLVLSVLTQTFYFIPSAALAAIIWVAINNLIDFTDLWEAWKHNKKDCFIMLITLVITFVFDTAVGLAAGIGTSVLFYLGDLAFASITAPVAFYSDHGTGIEEVILQGDLTFIQSARFQNFMDALYRTDPAKPDEKAHPSEKAFFEATMGFDMVFRPHVMGGAIREVIPRAVILDFSSVTVMDTTGLNSLQEAMHEARKLKSVVVIIKSRRHITASLHKFGIYNDASTPDVNLDEYLALSELSVKAKDGRTTQEPLITNAASASFDVQQQEEDIQFAVRQWPRTLPPSPSAIELGAMSRTSPLSPMSRKTQPASLTSMTQTPLRSYTPIVAPSPVVPATTLVVSPTLIDAFTTIDIPKPMDPSTVAVLPEPVSSMVMVPKHAAMDTPMPIEPPSSVPLLPASVIMVMMPKPADNVVVVPPPPAGVLPPAPSSLEPLHRDVIPEPNKN